MAGFVFPVCTILNRNITHRSPKAMVPVKQYPSLEIDGNWFTLCE